jgi:hypothetical protein
MLITPAQRASLPQHTVRAAEPPSVKNRPAFLALKSHLERAVWDLMPLGVDPIVLAASPNRFNDVDLSEWRAIRFGSFFTERNEYGVSTPHDYESDLARGPAGVRAAHEVLEVLEASANWRHLFSEAFDLVWRDQVLALVIQDGIPWLVFSASNMTDENHVFALWADEPLTYFGECIERFDWEMQESPPLRFADIRAIPPEQRVPKNVVRIPKPPQAVNRQALDRLVALLESAVQNLNTLAEDPIVIAASPNRWNDARSSDWRAIRFGAFFTEEPTYYSLPFNYERDLAAGPLGARAARDILDELEAANWRDLFSEAFDVGFRSSILALVIQDGIPWLVFSASFNPEEESHVFSLWSSEPLAYFGECVERFDWEIQETPPLKFQEGE